MKKHLTILISVALTAQLVSCGDAPAPIEETSPDTPDTTAAESITSGVPSDLDLNEYYVNPKS